MSPRPSSVLSKDVMLALLTRSRSAMTGVRSNELDHSRAPPMSNVRSAIDADFTTNGS
jgi:hypothetical protein